MFTFTVREPASVTLQVFDLAGRSVATLLREQWLAPGPHQVEFRHDGLPSGLYLGRLRIGPEIFSRKMFVRD